MQRKTALKNVLRIAVMTIRELALRKIAKSNIFHFTTQKTTQKVVFIFVFGIMTRIIQKFIFDKF